MRLPADIKAAHQEDDANKAIKQVANLPTALKDCVTLAGKLAAYTSARDDADVRDTSQMIRLWARPRRNAFGDAWSLCWLRGMRRARWASRTSGPSVALCSPDQDSMPLGNLIIHFFDSSLNQTAM